MSSSSSESDLMDNNDASLNGNSQFVELLSKYPVLLNKSQVPKIKIEKDKALLAVVKAYSKTFGKEITPKQIQKKIHNLKGDIKKKTDINATGNEKIILKEWEQKLLLLLDTGNNPTFNKIPGALQAGISTAVVVEDTNNNNCKERKTDMPPSVVTSVKRQKIQLQLFETEETKNLGNAELQRLVLLEQLQLIRLQKKKEELILKRLEMVTAGGLNIAEDGGLTYTNL